MNHEFEEVQFIDIDRDDIIMESICKFCELEEWLAPESCNRAVYPKMVYSKLYGQMMEDLR